MNASKSLTSASFISTVERVLRICVAILLGLLLHVGCGLQDTGSEITEVSNKIDTPNDPLAVDDSRIRVLVMDPLCARLGCACVPGHGQRDYRYVGNHLARTLGRNVELFYAESIETGLTLSPFCFDFVVGPRGVVLADASELGLEIQALAALTNKKGVSTVSGQLVVKSKEEISSLEQLEGKKVILGPAEVPETHRMAKRFLRVSGMLNRFETSVADSVESAVYAVADGEADATFIPDYLFSILEGCGKVNPGALKIIANTEPTNFVQFFAIRNHGRSPEFDTDVNEFREALMLLDPSIEMMETQKGFVSVAGWTDWRGASRTGFADVLPGKDSDLELVWEAKVTGPPMAGISATDRYVFVADKDAKLTTDIFRCFDAKTGQQEWTFEASSDIKMDYTNAPRATPVVSGNRVFVLGAFGNLHCLDVESGKPLWEKSLLKDLDGELPTWGYSATPLIYENLLIVNPGGENSSVVALDLNSGETVWSSPGHAAAYGAFVLYQGKDARQLIGFDASGLAAWNTNGERVWKAKSIDGRYDFNVGTPLLLGDTVFVASENNASRTYDLSNNGSEDSEVQPALINDDLAPDTCSPIAVGDYVYCSAYGELYCLRRDTLETVWAKLDDRFYDHTNLIAGDDHFLVWNSTGDMIVVNATDEYEELKSFRPFGDDSKSMSHPAFVDCFMYIRDESTLKCFRILSR